MLGQYVPDPSENCPQEGTESKSPPHNSLIHLNIHNTLIADRSRIYTTHKSYKSKIHNALISDTSTIHSAEQCLPDIMDDAVERVLLRLLDRKLCRFDCSVGEAQITTSSDPRTHVIALLCQIKTLGNYLCQRSLIKMKVFPLYRAPLLKREKYRERKRQTKQENKNKERGREGTRVRARARKRRERERGEIYQLTISNFFMSFFSVSVRSNFESFRL